MHGQESRPLVALQGPLCAPVDSWQLPLGCVIIEGIGDADEQRLGIAGGWPTKVLPG